MRHEQPIRNSVGHRDGMRARPESFRNVSVKDLRRASQGITDPNKKKAFDKAVDEM